MKNMLKRMTLPIVFILIGALMAVAGVLYATVLRPDSSMRATMDAPKSPYVVTKARLFGDVISSEATVTAQSNGKPVSVAVADETDAVGWLGDSANTQVTGLSSWERLKLEEHAAQDEKAQHGAVAQLDTWKSFKSGEGAVKVKIPADARNLVVLASTDGKEPAPQLTVTWTQETSVGWAIALAITGVVILALGLALMLHNRARRTQAKQEQAAQQQERVQREETMIETTVGERTVKLPSRRAIREARQRGETEIVVEGHSFSTQAIPVVRKVRDPEASSRAHWKEGARDDS